MSQPVHTTMKKIIIKLGNLCCVLINVFALIISLLKVHMQLKGFSVFIDVERLEAGKFDNNLLSSIRQAKNFLLVLTPNSLDRCTGDIDCKDWVHRVRHFYCKDWVHRVRHFYCKD